MEKVVAALFVLAFLAGCGFIAAYIGLEVGGTPARATRVRSNLALGTSLSVALLALGVGSIIWVRHLTPDIEIAEERHDLRSDPADRAAFKEDFAEGAAISQVTKRPLLRRTLLLATAPLALRRSCCCATSARCRGPTCGTRCGARQAAAGPRRQPAAAPRPTSAPRAA